MSRDEVAAGLRRRPRGNPRNPEDRPGESHGEILRGGCYKRPGNLPRSMPVPRPAGTVDRSRFPAEPPVHHGLIRGRIASPASLLLASQAMMVADMAPTTAANAPLARAPTRGSVPDPSVRAPTAAGSVSTEGPWGSLRSFSVYVATPDWILEQFPVPSAQTAWTFLGMTRADVAVLFDEPDIPEDVREELRDQSRWNAVGDQIQIAPSGDAILALSPQARARIYAVLARWEANEFHHSPYFVPAGDVQAWVGNTVLSPELVNTVVRTAYPKGRTLCFSDVSLLVAMTRSHAEARGVIKALSRTRTAILRLRLDEFDDVKRIRDYGSFHRVMITPFQLLPCPRKFTLPRSVKRPSQFCVRGSRQPARATSGPQCMPPKG